jgi:hypothetical protein
LEVKDMVYKAKMEIGGYKPGEVVPDEKAELWLQMYDVPPVEKVAEVTSSVAPVAKPAPKADSTVMVGDYLDRPSSVVVKNIKTDVLSKSVLLEMQASEKKGKKRNAVLDALHDALEAV